MSPTPSTFTCSQPRESVPTAHCTGVETEAQRRAQGPGGTSPWACNSGLQTPGIPVFSLSFLSCDSSESVKQRNDVFYLQPERSCVPNSPMWYSTFPIDPGTLDTMLTRILMVREVHEDTESDTTEPT